MTVTLASLAPETTYHYRFVATNEYGQAAGEPEGSFSTPAGKGPYIADGARMGNGLPAGNARRRRAPAGQWLSGAIQAAANGGAITYVASGPFAEPEGNRSLEATQILSSRDREGWHSKDITTPNSAGTGMEIAGVQEYEFFSPDLSLALLRPFECGGRLAEPPLSPPAADAEQGRGRSRKRRSTCATTSRSGRTGKNR